ncbi:MAG: PLP-dependent aminotransferase family protein [Kiritimatiellales bacterium]
MSEKKYEQVMQHVLQLIREKVVQEGEKIPSVRGMAQITGLSPMTVLEAYRRLESDGVIESAPRSGYRVLPASFRRTAAGNRTVDMPPAKIEIRTETVKLHAQTERLLKAAMQSDLIPLGAGLPDPADLPSDELSRHLARAARTDPERINRYAIGEGVPELRRQLARLMAGSGSTVSPDGLVTVAGITQGLLLALRAVAGPGDTIAVESPGYYGFYSVLNFLHLNAIEIPTSPQSGLDPDELERVLKSRKPPKALIFAPTFSNPTGALIPDENRKRIVALARRYNLTLIEDDTYGELAFSARRPPPVKALLPDRTIYLGSLSKILAPGYRIAWIAGGRHHNDILRCHGMSVLSLPPVTQLAVAACLKQGGLQRHLRRLSRKYEKNLRLMEQIILDRFPSGTQVTHPAGGHFLWVRLPKGSAVQLAEKAMQKGISIAPGTVFSSRQHYKQYLRLNGALTVSDRIVHALQTLGELAG